MRSEKLLPTSRKTRSYWRRRRRSSDSCSSGEALLVALKLYQDDCSNAHLLKELLQQDEHTVVRPIDVGLMGQDDDIHFAYASEHKLAILTKNPGDFLDLHELDPKHS